MLDIFFSAKTSLIRFISASFKSYEVVELWSILPLTLSLLGNGFGKRVGEEVEVEEGAAVSAEVLAIEALLVCVVVAQVCAISSAARTLRCEHSSLAGKTSLGDDSLSS